MVWTIQFTETNPAVEFNPRKHAQTIIQIARLTLVEGITHGLNLICGPDDPNGILALTRANARKAIKVIR